jgi:hypothetical protein
MNAMKPGDSGDLDDMIDDLGTVFEEDIEVTGLRLAGNGSEDSPTVRLGEGMPTALSRQDHQGLPVLFGG